MPIDYTSRDFASVKSDLVARARATIPEWTSTSSPDFTMMLIDLWSYVADVQNYYIDRAYTEAYLDTATQASSVRAIARLMGYLPNPRTSATTTVTVSNSSGSAITLAKGTRFIAPAVGSKVAVYFVSTSDVTAAANSNATVPVAEGRDVTETLTSNFTGDGGSSFPLTELKIVPNSLVLTVGSTTYTYTSRLSDVGSTAPAFTSVTDSTDATRVVLGNGVNGKVPDAGSTIVATYRVGQGSGGNVAANAITTMSSPVVSISIASSALASGGTNPEDLVSIKANAPALRRIQDRAVTLNDYKTMMLGFSGASKAVALSTVSSGAVTVNYAALPTYSNYQNIPSGTSTLYLTEAAGSPNFGPAGTDIHNNMTNYLQSRSMIGVTVANISTTINLTDVYVAFNSVVVKDGHYQEVVKSNIDAAVRALFSWSSIDFNTVIRLSTILSAAQSVEGVQSVFISNLGTSSGGSTVADHTPTATTASAISLPVLRTITFAGVSGGIA